MHLNLLNYINKQYLGDVNILGKTTSSRAGTLTRTWSPAVTHLNHIPGGGTLRPPFRFSCAIVIRIMTHYLICNNPGGIYWQGHRKRSSEVMWGHQFLANKSRYDGAINPRTDGWGRISPPPPGVFFFVNKGKTAARSATKFAITNSSSFLHRLRKLWPPTLTGQVTRSVWMTRPHITFL